MRVLAVSGWSGGHIFPALALLEEIKDKYADVTTLLVLPKRCIARNISPALIRVKYFSFDTLNLKLNIKNIFTFWQVLKGCLESMFILLSFRPDKVVAFGSLACAPMVFWAWIFRIEIFIHEQNVIPGRANRLLARLADHIAVSFNETKDFLKDSQDKIILTGNPLRKSLKIIDKQRALDFFGLDKDRFTILVMGGSQGSQSINKGFSGAISRTPFVNKIQVIHLAGSRDLGILKDSYERLGIKYRLFDFLEAMEYAYSVSDLALSRAGALSISELIFFKKPAVIIPYPFAYQHQMSNARILEKNGCALILEDKALNRWALKDILENLINNPQRLNKMGLNYTKIPQLESRRLLMNAVLNI